MNVLEIVADACDDLGLQRPASLFSGYDEGDTSDRKMLRSLTRTAKFLAATYEWQALQCDWTFVAVAGEVQPGGQPPDLLRHVKGTVIDLDTRWTYEGPLEPYEYQQTRQWGNATSACNFMIAGDALMLCPPVPAGRRFALRYVSNAICRTPSGARRDKFASDTDIPLWDGELMTLGAIYHFRKSERMDYASDEYDFKLMMRQRIAMDGHRRILDMNDGGSDRTGKMLARLKSSVIVNFTPELRFTGDATPHDDARPGEGWTNPADGQLHIFTGAAWRAVSGGGSGRAPRFTFLAAPHDGASVGDGWVDPNTYRLHVFTGVEWFGVGGGAGRVPRFTDLATAHADAAAGDGWRDPASNRLHIFDGTQWDGIGGGGSSAPVTVLARFTRGETPETSTPDIRSADGTFADGDEWFQPSSSRTYIHANGMWVEE